jgi:hypothetical protein
MALSEKYDLSILGKVGLTAGVAGEFSILVTGDSALPGWARVQVRRHRSSSLSVAADVNVGFNNKLTNLPRNPQEFLGAVLGVNAKSFLNVFDKALELSDAQQFEKAVDGLAKNFIEEFTGKSFAQLKGPEFANTLGTLSKAVSSHSNLGDRAVTLFDRYFNRLEVLEPFLKTIAGLDAAGFASLRKGLDGEQWNILSQLTDGDPFGFLVNQVVINKVKVDARTELKKRANSVLELIQNPGGKHDEIRRTVELAHSSFGIDRFLVELARLDTPEKLKAAANQKLGMFVTRLLGELDSSNNFRQSFDRVHAVLAKIDSFGATLFKAFSEAANSSWKLALHAQYSRATDTDALVDVSINMTTPAGRELMQSAGKGDFVEIVTNADTDLVRLQKGLFTHKTTRESAFSVNISGWHLNYKYEGFDRVITSSEQSLVPSEQGIRIDSTVTLLSEKERRRRDESTHINFLLRALAESKHVVRAPSANTAFLIETLQSLSAKYEITFKDGDTSLTELAEYLAFAGELGFDKQGATASELEPVLPKAANGGFGSITAKYEVRFGEAAVNALLSRTELSKQDENEMRRAMRRNLRTNYLKGNTNRDVAIAYSTPEVYDFYLKSNSGAGGRFVDLESVTVTLPAGKVVLDKNEIRWLDTLYQIEEKMIGAIRELYKVLGGSAIDPRDFEKKLGKFSSAMKAYDDFDQAEKKNGNGANSIFVLFDKLVSLSSGNRPGNASMLKLTSEVTKPPTEKIFLSDAAVESSAIAQAAG